VALKRLLGFKNIELKIVTEGNFHAKGYIFKQKEYYSFIIGSSNLTQGALGFNKEWNVKLSSLENGGLMKNLLEEFWHTHKYATLVDGIWLEQYSTIYETISRAQKAVARRAEDPEKVIPLKKVYPNKMQKEALRSLEILRDQGKNKALLISATGTGKTYLSAFDVAKFQPKKFLFVVHRENIARAALRSYKAILGNDINAGFIAGGRRDYEKDFVFATISSICKDEHLNRFPQDHFDYIVIDEVHRAGANTYQKVLGYFKPKFCLGMSATPERSDGNDIFKNFDYNIAYEIRLNRAMEEQMVTPFHYFGVTEIEVDGKILDDKVDFNKLVCQERVDRIIEAGQFYGWDSGRVKGLVFCSRIEECHKLSEEFNKRGYETIALDGSSSEELREKSIERLEQDGLENKLDYIFTVDIFNEGVDIPSINQIIMLRPTQSAIIFVQQLGRGLRITEGKEFLTIIDFIGNYSNNYLIPIALFGDRTFNKDTIRKLMHNGSGVIPGCSTIHFDEITEKRIFEAIDRTNLTTLRDLKPDYLSLKAELGRIPMMEDFLNYGRRDPYAFVKYAKSYYNFLVTIRENLEYKLTPEEMKLLEFYSKEILNCKRADEVYLLALLIGKGSATLDELNIMLQENLSYSINNDTAKGLVNVLNGTFFKDADREKYGIKENIVVFESDNSLIFRMDSSHRNKLLKQGFHKYLNDAIQFCEKKIIQNHNPSKFRDGFLLYEKYGRKDACRILNWEKDDASTMYGYRIKYGTCPIFVTYEKPDDVEASQDYDDNFINEKYFSWMTRSRLTLKSTEVRAIQGFPQTIRRIPLFVKKSDDEGSDFYYLGDVTPKYFKQTTIKDKDDKELPIVNITFELSQAVDEQIYDYIVGYGSESPNKLVAL
jgi:superfamily II DNA or RNA helicase